MSIVLCQHAQSYVAHMNLSKPNRKFNRDLSLFAESDSTTASVLTHLHDRVEFWLQTVEVISLYLNITHYLILQTSCFLQLQRQSSAQQNTCSADDDRNCLQLTATHYCMQTNISYRYHCNVIKKENIKVTITDVRC